MKRTAILFLAFLFIFILNSAVYAEASDLSFSITPSESAIVINEGDSATIRLEVLGYERINVNIPGNDVCRYEFLGWQDYDHCEIRIDGTGIGRDEIIFSGYISDQITEAASLPVTVLPKFSYSTDDPLPFAVSTRELSVKPGTPCYLGVKNYSGCDLSVDYDTSCCEARLVKEDWLPEDTLLLTINGISGGKTKIIIHPAEEESVEKSACINVDIRFSTADILNLRKVRDVGIAEINYSEEDDSRIFRFGLRDFTSQFVAVPVLLEVKVVNVHGNTIYEKTKSISPNAFYKNSAGEYIADGIQLFDSGVDPDGSLAVGTASSVFYRIFQPGYWDFCGEIPVDHLPYTDYLLEIPERPFALYSNSSDGSIEAVIRIDKADYEVSDPRDEETKIKIFLSGEMVYVSDGPHISRQVPIIWKLYDAEGYVVESGTAYSNLTEEGEKFKNTIILGDSFKPGSYALIFLNCQPEP